MREASARRRAPGGARGRLASAGDVLVRSVGPILLALAAGAALLAALGRDPGAFYGDVLEGGLTSAAGLQNSVTRMAPLLLIGAGLVVVFRAGLWNLGGDGQLLVAAVLVAGAGPPLDQALPNGLALLLLWLVAALAGAAWALVPALLRALYGVSEVVTSLVTSFVAIGVANLLVKGPFRDEASPTVPQTRVLPPESRLPDLPGTSIHAGILVALAVVLAAHVTMTRTSFGLRLEVLGASPRAAAHAGLGVRRLVVASFAASGAIIGLAGAAEILGVWGYVRADWNPGLGLLVVPVVFLARLNALATIPFVAFIAVLSIGGDLAARRADLPSDFLLALAGLLLVFMALTEYLGRRRELGASYLPGGLGAAPGRADADRRGRISSGPARGDGER